MYLECSIIICIFLQHMDLVSELNVYIYINTKCRTYKVIKSTLSPIYKESFIVVLDLHLQSYDYLVIM